LNKKVGRTKKNKYTQGYRRRRRRRILLIRVEVKKGGSAVSPLVKKKALKGGKGPVVRVGGGGGRGREQNKPAANLRDEWWAHIVILWNNRVSKKGVGAKKRKGRAGLFRCETQR